MLQHFIKSLSNYFQESYEELRKVTWPTRNRAVRLTFIVLGFCLVAALAMGMMDLGFNRGYLYLVNYAAKVSPITTPVETPAETTPLTVTPSAPADTESDIKLTPSPSEAQPSATPPSEPAAPATP